MANKENPSIEPKPTWYVSRHPAIAGIGILHGPGTMLSIQGDNHYIEAFSKLAARLTAAETKAAKYDELMALYQGIYESRTPAKLNSALNPQNISS